MDRPILFRIWIKLNDQVSNRKTRLPSSSDALYLDGFPRSGNTYFTAAMRSAFPELTFANHLHCLAPLRISAANAIPSFVLMRRPVEAIASRLLQIQDGPSRMQSLPMGELSHRLVNDWARYYSYCDKNRTKISLITFEDAVKNPYECLRRIAEILGLDEDFLDAQRFQNFHCQFRNNDRTKRQGSTSYPNKARSENKKLFFPLIESSREYLEAQSIYDRLRFHTIAIE